MVFRSKQVNSAVLSLLFVSGACALIYQVVWTRIITQVFGTTVYAISAVLAAFMIGLGIGSYFLGKVADRSRNPLRLYALYEIGIGISALVTLYLFNQLEPLYLWLHHYVGDSLALITAARFLVAFFLVVGPTILMGATLPILSRFTTDRLEKLGHNVAGLYAINTAGSVAGSLLAGFVLIRTFGIHATIYLAVSANVIVGLVAWWLSKAAYSFQETSSATVQEAVIPAAASRKVVNKPSVREHRVILWVLAISGFTAFAYEIYWTRALVMIVGNSTYAFVIILTAFLTGIALGGWAIKSYIDKFKNPVVAFGWAEVGIGLSAAATMPLIFTMSDSQSVQSLLGGVQARWDLVLLLRFFTSFAVMLIPTVLIGATFPLVAKIYATTLAHAGADVGKVYAVNTLGNILGAIIPAFIILPLVGISKGILLMAALNVVAGALVFQFIQGPAPRLRWAVPGLLAALSVVIVLIPVHFQFSSGASRKDTVLYYKEGVVATTKVIATYKDRQDKHIINDGVSIGGTGTVDYKQQMLAHLPKLFLRDAKSELSIGLGSGILIGESAKHENIKELTVVEIAPSVVEGADAFKMENGDIKNNPRIEIVVNDGVNYLLTSAKTYDIISSDAKSKPEHGGNGVFFSKDYYQLALKHLSESGIMIQWVPTHMPYDDYISVMKSFVEAFPHVSLWFMPPGNSFMLGSKEPLKLDYGRVQKMLADPRQPLDGLRKYGITTAEAMLSHYVASEDVIKAHIDGARENSQEFPIIEFYSIQEYAVPENVRQLQNLGLMLTMRGKTPDWSWVKNGSAVDMQHVADAYEAEQSYLTGLRELMEKGPDHYDSLRHYFDAALQQAPENQDVRHHLGAQLRELAKLSIGRKRFEEAENFAREATTVSKSDGEAYYLYGMLLASKGDMLGARTQLEACIGLKPLMINARQALAANYAASGMTELAAEQLRVVVELDPRDTEAARELEILKSGLPAGVQN